MIDFGLLTPQHHQGDDFDLLQGHRTIYCRHGTINHDFAQGWRQSPGALKKGNETNRLGTQVPLLIFRIDTKAITGCMGKLDTLLG